MRAILAAATLVSNRQTHTGSRASYFSQPAGLVSACGSFFSLQGDGRFKNDNRSADHRRKSQKDHNHRDFRRRYTLRIRRNGNGAG